MRSTFYIFSLLIAVFQTELLAQDNTKTFNAAKDNTIYSESENSNGIGDYLFAGNTAGKNARRALISFQINIPVIPEFPLLISKATLHIKPNKTASNASQTFTLHRLLKDWGESASNANSNEGQGALAQIDDATWNYSKSKTIPWTFSGADYESTPSATFTISDFTDQSISTTGLLDDVKFWQFNSSKNFGWILIGNEGDAATSYRFDSKQNPSLLGPRLEVNYTFATNLDKLGYQETNKIVYLPESSIIQYTDNENTTEIQLFDVSGKQVTNSVSGKIPTTHLLPGFYIARSIRNNTVSQNKFYVYQ